MKVQGSQNQSAQGMYQTNSQIRAEKEEGMKEHSAGNLKEETIYAGDLNLGDSILEKKVKAQRDAIKTILNQFASDQETDTLLEEKQHHVEELRAKNGQVNEEIQALDEKKAELKEKMGIADDSQEQKDLELLEKRNLIMKGKSTESLTEEEMGRLKEMGPLTEYQEMALGYEDAKEFYETQIDENDKIIKREFASIQGIKRELLKRDPMLDAQKEADQILENASKERIGMLVEEMKEHVDEIQKEEEKKAEEAQEKKEEEEKAQEKDAIEEQNETVNDTTKDIKKASDAQEAFKAELKNVIDRQQILEEDMKGILLDQRL